ncbi:hypothetical protein FF38_04060 [Lucilia cuprina]|uniref:Uncharacterized protein n=1 Tax=Lucilia cuprina TaxID=7375 RepID=A0A0L0BRZ3_LUCCU|nr:hypothetical protein FF38_04060 [Lucilia cuprina]
MNSLSIKDFLEQTFDYNLEWVLKTKCLIAFPHINAIALLSSPVAANSCKHMFTVWHECVRFVGSEVNVYDRYLLQRYNESLTYKKPSALPVSLRENGYYCLPKWLKSANNLNYPGLAYMVFMAELQAETSQIGDGWPPIIFFKPRRAADVFFRLKS